METYKTSVICDVKDTQMYTDKTVFTSESSKGIKVTSNVCPSKSFASHQFPQGSRTLRLLVRCYEIKNKANGNKISMEKSQHINI